MSNDQNPNADWWCWTENEPSTFRCRERHHDVRPSRRDPSVETWRAAMDDATRDMSAAAVVEWRAALGQSTSAQLRQTQTDLAASQADLTHMQEQRDKALRLLEYALHLRRHGENAPGGNETWAQFDRDAEAFLRRLNEMEGSSA